MYKIMQLEVYCQLLANGSYFLYAINDEEPLPASEWTPLLFQWHQTSFYGTDLKIYEQEIPFGFYEMKVEGVELDAFGALELFGSEPFNHFVQWQFDDFSQTLLAIAPVVYETIKEGEWIPDFHSWNEGNFQWQVPDEVWEEFLPDFWEEPINETAVLSSENEPLLAKDFVKSWFHHGVESFLMRKGETYQKWQARKQILVEAAQEGKDLSVFFDAKRFRSWAGLTENELPFTFGLQLEEPKEDGEMWKLTAFLRNKKRADQIVSLRHLPKKWQNYQQDLLEEQERICTLLPWLAAEEDHDLLKIKDELYEEEAWEFLTSASETLLLLDIEILLPAWWQSLKNANLRLKARVNSGSSGPSFVGLDALMDYEWRFSLNDVDLSEDEFRRLMEQNRRLINIGGNWIKLDPAFIKQIQSIMEKAEKQGMRVQDFIEQQLMYGEDERAEEEILEENDERIFSRIQIEMHPRLRSFIDTLTHLSHLPEQPVPSAFQGELRPYQVKGMSWLYFLRQYGFGAILADDMGLGKTIQLISYLLLVKERQPDVGPCLIICPTTVLGNWQKELEKFSPNLNVYLHYGSNRKKAEDFTKVVKADGSGPDVVLTTYGLSHLDFDELSTIKWGTVVLDEAQNIKNAQTKQSRAIRKLKGDHHIALTGTPMENRLTELWSIFDFTNKGYLGSLARFQERFVIPIEREKDREKIQELRNLIRPFLLRRTKKDEEVALNLPDKLEQKEYCPLTAEQATLYQEVIDDTFNKIAELSGFERKGYVLRLIGRLKQLCNHPNLYLKDLARSDNLIERSSKLEKLVELTDIFLEQEESGLIFTQYIGMGNMIKAIFEERYNIRVPFLNGSTTKKQRDQMIEDFQNGEFPILLLSLKAGGTGLNLTAANHVIHYDRWWNPAVENQATDRAYRIGQTKFVHVHKLITTGTLEEKIDKMLETKQALNDEIIQSDQWIADLSDDELYDILRLD